MSNGFIMKGNPFFKQDIDKLCLICNCMFKMDQIPHSIFDKLEQTQSQMHVYEALESISNFKEIKIQKQAEKVCEFCYINISRVIRFCEMCNKSASFLKSYIEYQEMDNISQSFITNPETYVDRYMSTKLTDVNVLSIKSEVLNGQEEQDVKMQVWPELPMISSMDTLSITVEKSKHEMKEIGITNIETWEEELCMNEKMLNDEVEQDVKLEIWPEFPIITTGDTLNSTTETPLFKMEEAIIQEMGNTSEREIRNNETYLERSTLITTATLINNDKEKQNENHEKIFDSGVQKVKCEVCDRFYSKNYIKNHLQIHTDERPYICEICGKTFKDPSTKWSHKQTHNDLHECKVCGKRFVQSKYLKAHLSVHSDERPFVCENCGKCFSSKKYLGRHMIRHGEEKRHECKVCGKKFANPINLKDHLIVHSNERPFACEKCGKCFPLKRYRSQHMLSHLTVKRYECHLCGNRFAHRHTLKIHLSTKCKGKRC